MADTNPKNNNLKKEAATLEEEILQSRERIAELDKLMAAADEAELTRLRQKLDYENLVLEKKKEALDAASKQLEEERKITEAASDSADALEKFLDNSSIARTLSDELSTRYSSIASKANELASLAGDNAEQVKAVAEFNNQIYEIESVREKILQSIKEGDVEEQALLQQKNESLSAGLQTIIANGTYTEEQKRIMDKILGIQTDITKEMLATVSLTKEEKAIYDKLTSQADELKTKINAVWDTVKLFLKKPSTIIGGMVIGAGFLVDKIAEVNKKLGTSMFSMNGFSASAGAMSFFFEDAVDTAKTLAHHLGDSRNVTLGMQASTNLMASNLGLSGEEAAELSAQFGHLRGLTHEQGMDMMASAKATALARGVLPNALMKDLADNTEMFSKFAKNGGENIIAAGAAARQLGLDMKTLNTMATSLMDIETSIEKELEASAMLGRDINLSRARELIYTGELEEAQKEITRQLGSKAQWDSMDLYQKQAAADALGIQVSEVEKLYKNQENLAGASGVVAEKFSWLAESSNYIANEWGGGIIKGIGGAVIALGGFGKGIETAKDGVKGLREGASSLSSMWEKVKGFFGAAPVTQATGAIGGPLTEAMQSAGGAATETITESIGEKLEETATGKLEEKATEKIEEKLDSGIDSVSEKLTGGGTPDVEEKVGKTPGAGFNATQMMKGAAAMLILAAALYVMAKAFQEFGDVTWPAVGMGLTALAGMAAIAFVLSKIKGQMIEGAFAIAILGAALIPFAYSMSLIAGLDIGAVIAAGAGLLIFGAAVFGLGSLLFTGVGAALFAAGVVGLVALGSAIGILGMGLNMVGNAFSSVTGSLPVILEQISLLSQINYLPIFGLATALTTLGIALSAVSAAGIDALPALSGLSNLGVALGLSSGGATSTAKTETNELLNEIKGLRADLNGGKVAVYMDGQRVTAAVAAANSRSPLTVK